MFAAVFGEMPPAYAARLAMECSSPASGHRASRNSRNREAIPVSSFDSALAARLWHSPPRRRASVASAASSRAPAVAPAPRAFSSSAHLRNRLAHALHRNTSNAPRLTACPVHVPHPKHLCIHPAECMFVPGTYVCAFGSSFETPAFVPDGLRVSSRTVSSCSATRRSSSAPLSSRSNLPRASVERPQASVSCCCGTRSATRPTRARLASRARSACAGPRSRASSGPRARYRACARCRATKAPPRAPRARASREGQTFINPVRLSNAQDRRGVAKEA